MNTSESKKLIDVEKALRSKYKGWVPRPLVKWLRRLIHEDELNELMRLQKEVGGVAFARKLVEYLGITTEWVGGDKLPPLTDRTIFVSNHPLGGADGIILTALLGEVYEGNMYFLVNDLLMAVYQFQDTFLPVNKYGRQGRESAKLITAAVESKAQVVTFPAGLCSRMNAEGNVRDLRWNTSFLRMAKRSGRQIVPLFFEGSNSPRFYRWARWRERLGLKFNYELVLLPDELIRAQGKHFRIFVGDAVELPELPTGQALQELANRLRDQLYTYPEKV